MGQYVPSGQDPEQHRIAQAFSSPDDYRTLNELGAFPKKPKDGTIVFVSAALATASSLADGRGIYVYYGSAWHCLTKGGIAAGLVLKDAAATPHYWSVTVSTLGVLITTDLGTSPP